jgi:hypothetical protein
VVGAGWDACPASWWIEIAATLTAAGLTWPRPACLQDLRFWDGQVRAGFRKAIPSRRQLARRWRWTDWKVRDLLRTEDWKERRMSAPPKNLPTSSQLPPGFEPIEQVQPFPASQPPPNRLPKTSTRAYLTGTQITDTQDRPAGVSLEEVSGQSYVRTFGGRATRRSSSSSRMGAQESPERWASLPAGPDWTRSVTCSSVVDSPGVRSAPGPRQTTQTSASQPGRPADASNAQNPPQSLRKQKQPQHRGSYNHGKCR